MDEFMFLQGNVEEKIGTLRLGGELANTAKTKADTDLVEAQEELVDQQKLTEVQETAKRTNEASLVEAQEELTDAQKTQSLTESMLRSQQPLTELQNTRKLELENDVSMAPEKAFYDGVVAGTQDTYRDYAAEMRIMGIQESTFQQTPAYKKVEMLKDAAKLRLATATETGTDATELSEVNKVMRFIGEPPVTALNDNSLASECVRLLRDTDTELQGRGWWFNTEEDVELTPNGSGQIIINNTMLSVEAYDYDTRMEFGGYLYDLNKKSADNWTSSIKAKVIYKRTLSYTPQKYREYLSVRVAILLTELYPQSGVDIQRLPKMEAELRAYFKDREFDDANYSVFDNYDAASRIGINRNYDLT